MYTPRTMLLAQQHPSAAHNLKPKIHASWRVQQVGAVLLQATLCRAVLPHLLYTCTYLTTAKPPLYSMFTQVLDASMLHMHCGSTAQLSGALLAALPVTVLIPCGWLQNACMR